MLLEFITSKETEVSRPGHLKTGQGAFGPGRENRDQRWRWPRMRRDGIICYAHELTEPTRQRTERNGAAEDVWTIGQRWPDQPRATWS